MQMLGTSGIHLSAFISARSHMCTGSALAMNIVCMGNVHDAA